MVPGMSDNVDDRARLGRRSRRPDYAECIAVRSARISGQSLAFSHSIRPRTPFEALRDFETVFGRIE